MSTRGAQADDGVSGLDVLSVDDLGFFDHAHAETGQVVVDRHFHARMLCRLAADQGGPRQFAAPGDSADDARSDIHVQLRRDQVVQEEQRFRSDDDHIVDAHCDQVDPDAFVSVILDGHFNLCADAVGAGNQDGTPVAFHGHLEQSAESAQVAQDLHTPRAGDRALDSLDQLLTGVDVHAGSLVGQ